MKKLVIFLIVFLFSFGITFSHPGRTDSSGGHTCKTNCANRGLSQGEYHYHNSIPQNSSSNTLGRDYTENKEDSGHSIWFRIIWGVVGIGVFGAIFGD